MKPYKVAFTYRMDSVDVTVQARSHEEAFYQALFAVGADYEEVGNATITPLGIEQ